MLAQKPNRYHFAAILWPVLYAYTWLSAAPALRLRDSQLTLGFLTVLPFWRHIGVGDQALA
jgi:hypothetical protein